MINNLELIKPLLKFESKDDFYYLQILKRKKDQSEEEKVLGRNNNARTIKNYYISSITYLEEKMPEIIKLCEVFNARASIILNKRSYRNTAFKTLEKIAGTMANGDYSHIKTTYSKACGVTHSAKKEKTWIVDIDDWIGSVDQCEELNDMKEFINGLQPQGNKIITTLPTKSGIHLITSPFNVMEFRKKYNSVDLHRDNPVNLYIP